MVVLACLPLACAGARPPAAVPAVDVTPLAPHVWMHTTYKDLPGVGPFRSNGLIVETAHGVVLIDTAWDDAQTAQLLAWTTAHLHQPVHAAIVTHAHADKMGGVAALHRAGVETYASAPTNTLAATRALVPARHALALDHDVEAFADGELEIYYPGPGHTRDNRVVYVPAAGVLFGGCLIRPAESDGLGNTADADVAQWASSVAHAQARYPQARVVVPSHGEPGGPALLEHTIAIAGAAR